MTYKQLQCFSDKVSSWVCQIPGISGTGIEFDENHINVFVIYLEHELNDNIKKEIIVKLQKSVQILWKITGKIELQ